MLDDGTFIADGGGAVKLLRVLNKYPDTTPRCALPIFHVTSKPGHRRRPVTYYCALPLYTCPYMKPFVPCRLYVIFHRAQNLVIENS